MGALLALLPTLLSTVSRFIPDPAQQAQAQIELTKLVNEQQNAIYEEMSKVMTADAASEGVLTRNARPIVALGFASMAGVTFLFAIIDAVLGTHSVHVLTDAMAAIPSDVKNMILTLVGGWSALRTVEKVATTIKR